MPIPDFQSCLLPLLELAADDNEHSLREAREALAARFSLTPDEREELLPSGRQRRFDNRVAWAKVYLEQAGLLSSARRAHFSITDRGRSLLAERPERIDIALLEKYAEFRNFRSTSRRQQAETASVEPVAIGVTPEEALDQAYQSIEAEVLSELLTRIQAASPRFFEKVVLDVLHKMGYGSGRSNSVRATGGAGDEGIDGVIDEDRLGLDTIYVQAKRWQSTVGRPEVQKFVGALHGKRARKGVFITTGSFSAEARQYVEHIEPKVVLIAGHALARYMLDFDVGVTVREIYQLKRIDSDYFLEE